MYINAIILIYHRQTFQMYFALTIATFHLERVLLHSLRTNVTWRHNIIFCFPLESWGGIVHGIYNLHGWPVFLSKSTYTAKTGILLLLQRKYRKKSHITLWWRTPNWLQRNQKRIAYSWHLWYVLQSLTLISAWICNYIHYHVWDVC